MGDGVDVGGSGRDGGRGGGDGDGVERVVVGNALAVSLGHLLGLGLGLDADAERFVVYVGSQTETQMKGGKEEGKQWYGVARARTGRGREEGREEGRQEGRGMVGWGWLVGWLTGWLVGWLVGWLAGWLEGGVPLPDRRISTDGFRPR
ncbi:hypothetical protein HZH68_011089 [Vespula germanica]|uniref:Uncharacterized protein n=1 Tax=Vespula germanica TaxID=30212 RepID=A0A834JU34_VESGE|nr:hypothetical protein HZH68_011089 [Vespula germanica]